MLLGCALASADVHAHAFSLSCVQPPARTTGGPLNAAARPASQVNGTATPTTLFGALPSPLPRSRVRGAVVGRAHASLPLRVVLLQRGAPTVLAALPACLSASACGAAGAAAARCALTVLAALPACIPASTCACGAATYVCPDDCTGMGEGHCRTGEPALALAWRDATLLGCARASADVAATCLSASLRRLPPCRDTAATETEVPASGKQCTHPARLHYCTTTASLPLVAFSRLGLRKTGPPLNVL